VSGTFSAHHSWLLIENPFKLGTEFIWNLSQPATVFQWALLFQVELELAVWLVA
jgi:hypothetical protein